MKRLLTFSLLLFPVASTAQQGTITYNRATQYDFVLPDRVPQEIRDMVPESNVSSMVLIFNENESLMRMAPQVEPEVAADPRSAGLVARLKMGSSSRSDVEELLEAHVRYDDGTIVETRKFMDRMFLISSERPSYQWRISAEQKEFLGYVVQKATATRDSSTIEAWFTSEIPVSAGPGQFGGLPGMILIVTVNDGHLAYSATSVEMRNVDVGEIVAPDAGSEVTRDDNEAIVEERLEERRAMRRSRGRGRDRR